MYQKYKPPTNITDTLIKILAVIVFLFLFFAFYQLLLLIIGFQIICGIIVIYCMYKLFNLIGLVIMFPGCFKYYKGTIETSYSNSWKRRMQAVCRVFKKWIKNQGKIMEDISGCIVSLTYFKQTIQKYDENITTEKQQLVSILTKVIQIVQDIQVQKQANTDNQHQFKQRYNQFSHQLTHMQNILKQFQTPKGFLNQTQHNLFNQKLYKLSYGFGMYDQAFHYERKKVNKIDIVIFKGIKMRPQFTNEQIVLFCHPNGAYLEQFAIECSYANFYMQLGFNVCLWNYRGYSKSQGSPSVTNHQQDVLTVYDALKEWGYNVKITHGYSIGGPVAIHLAKHRKINLLIADRTFSSLYNMSKDYGTLLSIINYIVFWKDQTDFSKIFFQLKCNKVIINDPYDEVVANQASLKTGVAQVCLKNLKKTQQSKKDDSQIQMIEMEADTLQSSELQLNAPLVRQIVTQETIKIPNLMDKKLINALIYNIMPFAMKAEDNVRKPAVRQQKHLDQILSIFKKQISGLTHFESKSISQIKQASKQEKDLFSCVGFPSSCLFYLPILDLEELSKLDKEKIIDLTQNYINGLITYGYYPRNRTSNQDPISYRLRAIVELFKTYEDLCDVLKQSQQTFVSDKFGKSIQNLKQIVAYLGIFIYKNIYNDVYNSVGVLIPTQAGHNGDLNQIQLGYIRSLAIPNINERST